jgi:hypothetical protein
MLRLPSADFNADEVKMARILRGALRYAMPGTG